MYTPEENICTGHHLNNLLKVFNQELSLKYKIVPYQTRDTLICILVSKALIITAKAFIKLIN